MKPWITSSTCRIYQKTSRSLVWLSKKSVWEKRKSSILNNHRPKKGWETGHREYLVCHSKYSRPCVNTIPHFGPKKMFVSLSWKISEQQAVTARIISVRNHQALMNQKMIWSAIWSPLFLTTTRLIWELSYFMFRGQKRTLLSPERFKRNFCKNALINPSAKSTTSYPPMAHLYLDF